MDNNKQKTILKDIGRLDPESIKSYLGAGGYDALDKAIKTMSAKDLIACVKNSELRGRGGGGFLTGEKWEAVASQEGMKYLICNGSESDPRINSDELLLRESPYKIIEGMTLAAYGTGISKGYIYLAVEAQMTIDRLRNAIIQAEEYGFLGNSILESDFSFTIEIFTGINAFIIGEETALIATMEDKRPMPQQRPPYPSQQGLWNRPTLINNVETLANIPDIITNGSEWFKEIGTKNASGTMIFSMGGNVRDPGIYEVPLGTSLNEILLMAGGIPDNKAFKAAQIGGPTGIFVIDLETKLDFQTMQSLGGMLGSGSIHVMDEDTEILEVAKFFMNYVVDSSCGKCVPCREGTKRMDEILGYIVNGEASIEDLDNLKELAEVIKETSLCGLGKSAPNLVISSLNHFESDYINHLKKGIQE